MNPSIKSTVHITQSDFQQITQVIEYYFDGLYNGDTQLLDNIFQNESWLITPCGRRDKKQWLKDVANRATPKELQQDYLFSILAIDIISDQAMVKVYCPIFEFKYIDFLGLIKSDNQWQIVSKMYTDVAVQSS